MNIQEFAGAFLEELDEMLVQMEKKIIDLEAHGEDDETIQDLFRVAHTLKGSCAAMGFNEMKNLTHEMEQVLDEVRNHRLEVSDKMIQLLFQCFDGLQDFKTSISSGQETEVQVQPLMDALRSFLAGEEKDEEPIRPTPSEPQNMALSTDARLQMIEAAAQGLPVYQVSLEFAESTVMRGVRAYLAVDRLRELGDVLQVTPAVEEMERMEDDELRGFQVALMTQASPDEIRRPVANREYEKIAVVGLETETQTNAPDDTNGHSESTEGPNTEDQSVPASAPKQKGSKRKPPSIRVDVEQLETLMNLVGELVIDQARMDQVNRNLNKRYKSDEDVTTLSDISTHFSRTISELQDNIMTARMLPIESLFDRFPRIVRDLAHTLGKDIHLSLEGKETRLDRTVIEEIADPLIHLVRNAVDHGVESPERRIDAGKKEQGHVRLTASHEDNKVVITVQDDGAGIDAEKMRQSAIKKGVISVEESQGLSETESLNLIFRPGFSTAEKVSDVSGRGVGMDIVRNHIERLGGMIEIDTKIGEGTLFRIKLPLTLAIIPGLLIGVSERTFVVPISNVYEIVRIQPDSIQSVNGRPTILLREQAMPVLYLRQYFRLPAPINDRKYVQVVVVGTAEKRVAMVVDELYGNQEIVKKTLANRVGQPKGIAGATILGDGLVGLILDVATICNRAE